MKRTIEETWRQMSPYLDAVLDLEPEARQAWVDDLATRAPDVAAEVSAYLAELEELDKQEFLGVTAASIMAPPSLAGQRIGPYTLDEVIGHGGMGTVWLAHRSDGQFEGRVAVKILNTALVGHPSERRFGREGSVLAKLQHPNIAHLLDAGVMEGSHPYLILEYVRGDRIDRYCERLRLSIRQRVALFLDVLSAVAHAHSNLIVHRDIKPPNILVTDDGVVKLLDFGIAGLLSPDDEAPTSLTRNTAVGLTPGYAAPEQLLGETITTATDVYALGLVLFVLLAGRHPVSLQGKSNAELIRLTLETDPLRLSDATDNVRKGRVLRGDLDNIVAMALRRNPLERYPSAESFAQDLRRYLALEPVMAQPPSLRYLASKFVQRNWRSLAWGIAFAAVLMSAVAVTTSEMVAARRQRDEARFQARRAEASNEFMNVLMLSGNGSQSALTFDERVQLGVDLLDKQYRDDPHFAGRMLADLASEVRDNNEIGRANELFDRAYEMGRRTDDAELMVDALCARVYGDAIADIREGVMERIAEAQRLLTGIRHPDSMLQAQCLQAQGRFEQSRGNTVTAEALLQNAMRIVEESGNTHHVIYSMVLTDLGEVYLARNQLREVLRITQLIGEIQERNGRGGTSARLMVRQNAAIALISMGEVRAALTEREIINQRVRELESPGQEPFAYAINYAALLRRMARPAEALSALDGVLERLRRSGDPFILTQELLNLGATLTQLGRWDEADAALEEAASLVGNGNGNKSLAAQIEANQSRLGLARGDLQLAHRHRGRALELAGYHTAKPQRSLAQVLIVAADVALAERNAIEAESFARDALAIFESVARGPTTSADVGEALLRLAKARALSGVRAGTKVLLERAVECLTNGLGASHPLTIESRALLAGASV